MDTTRRITGLCKPEEPMSHQQGSLSVLGADMYGGSMPSNKDNDIDSEELLIKVLKRTIEDLIEAYFRTPHYISSKKYVERALRRIQYTYSYLVAIKTQQEFKGTQIEY